MTRKEFLKIAVGPTALATIPAGAMVAASTVSADTPEIPASSVTPKAITLAGGQFSLLLTAGQGLQCRLTHVPSNTLLADGPYSYSLGPIIFTNVEQHGSSVMLQGDTGTGITIKHRFTVDPKSS